MINHLTVGILTTSSWAGILASELLTSPIRGTIRVKHALRATTRVGISKVLRQTLAGSNSISIAAHGIRSTWTWAARSTNFIFICDLWSALDKRIPTEALLADALHRMANHMTLGINATTSRAGIDALLVDTGQLT